MKSEEFGRSMIEMLGVLAIVGLLSVGGIAGFSKAMAKYKFDRALTTLSLFIQEVMHYQKDWNRAYYDVYKNELAQYDLRDFIVQAGLKPNSWQVEGDKYFIDEAGGKHRIDARGSNMIEFQYSFGDKNDAALKERYQRCTIIISEVIRPLDNLFQLTFWKGNTRFGDILYGNSYCTESTVCLNDLTLGEIYEQCAACARKDSACGIVYLLK